MLISIWVDSHTVASVFLTHDKNKGAHVLEAWDQRNSRQSLAQTTQRYCQGKEPPAILLPWLDGVGSAQNHPLRLDMGIKYGHWSVAEKLHTAIALNRLRQYQSTGRMIWADSPRLIRIQEFLRQSKIEDANTMALLQAIMRPEIKRRAPRLPNKERKEYRLNARHVKRPIGL